MGWIGIFVDVVVYIYPRRPMYVIFTYILIKFTVYVTSYNVGNYSRH